jgi:predicted alpha/beta-hydrolase family hydrolase
MAPWIRAFDRCGVKAVAVDLPRGRADRAVDTFRDALGEHPGAAIGGHSFGGRVASLLAPQDPVAALVLLSYPLHPPGRLDDLRTAHWPAITCPTIALSGQSDPFANLSLLQDSVRLIPRVELVIYPGVAHRLIPVIDDATRRVTKFLLLEPVGNAASNLSQ